VRHAIAHLVFERPITSYKELTVAEAHALINAAEADGLIWTLADMAVKISGCQHSCARHHIADLGFHGLAKKIDGQAVPHYQLHVGGSGKAGQNLAFATDPIPAIRAPEAGISMLTAYKEGELNQYGLGNIMQLQLESIDEEDIQELAEYIENMPTPPKEPQKEAKKEP